LLGNREYGARDYTHRRVFHSRQKSQARTGLKNCRDAMGVVHDKNVWRDLSGKRSMPNKNRMRRKKTRANPIREQGKSRSRRRENRADRFGGCRGTKKMGEQIRPWGVKQIGQQSKEEMSSTDRRPMEGNKGGSIASKKKSPEGKV